MEKNKILSWLYGILMSIFIVMVVSFGVETFYPSPDYDICRPVYEENNTCNGDYKQETASYNTILFYIFSIIGLSLVISSLFIETTFIEVSLTISGFVLMIMGLTKNLNSKPFVFVSSVIMLILVIILGRKRLQG